MRLIINLILKKFTDIADILQFPILIKGSFYQFMFKCLNFENRASSDITRTVDLVKYFTVNCLLHYLYFILRIIPNICCRESDWNKVGDGFEGLSTNQLSNIKTVLTPISKGEECENCIELLIYLALCSCVHCHVYFILFKMGLKFVIIKSCKLHVEAKLLTKLKWDALSDTATAGRIEDPFVSLREYKISRIFL